MCNLTAPSPHLPAAKRHRSGTLAARRRSRTAKPAPPQRTKSNKISNLCAPTCGISSGAGTGWPRLAVFCDLKSLRNRPTYHENLIKLTTWFRHYFSIPKFYLALPFSPPSPTFSAEKEFSGSQRRKNSCPKYHDKGGMHCVFPPYGCWKSG